MSMGDAWRRSVIVSLGLLSSFAAAPNGREPAKDATADASGWSPLAQATWTTVRTGRPTVVVVTSPSSPASQQLRRALLEIPEARSWLAQIQFAELSAGAYPEKIKALRVETFPTVIAFRKKGESLEEIDRQTAPRDAYLVVGWLGTLGLDRQATARVDEGVTRAQFASGQAQPSGQHYP
ncbi:MAG: hypothetical protein IRY99_16970, partial [Isosphaeraceae bacterium]|nr:hypothetical protein [Isosphaeraceae bacterium]